MSSEYLILAGIILVSLIFFSASQTYFLGNVEEIKKAEVRAEAEELASLIYRISKDPANYLKYCQFLKLSNITINKSIMSYERSGYKFSFLIPQNIKDISLKEVTRVCFIKRGSKIEVVSKLPKCEIDGICNLDECAEDCPDCYGPNYICLDDNYCNFRIGENCKNSPRDCSCSVFKNYVCCPEDPKANEYGCVDKNRQNLKKGEECFCDNQCEIGLECNPTTPTFTAYKRACCEPGKKWNGSDCIITETFDIFIVPVQVTNQNAYFSIALSFKDHFLSVSPFKECSNRDDLIRFWIINISDCPNEAAASCSNHCSDCIDIGRRCARNMEVKLGVNYDKFVVLTNGGGWLGGCACDIPCDGASSSLIPCTSSLCIPSHEIGHDLGLGHVDCNVACHACLYYPFFNGPAPNCPDCGHQERAKFIMDYCIPMEKYGPAAYDFLKNKFKGTSPHAAGLKKWLEGCIP